MIWGGVPVDTDFVKNSPLFQDGLNRFEHNEWRMFWEDEIWADVKGYEGLYKISSFGRLKSCPRNGTIKSSRLLKCSYDADGYPQYVLCKKNKLKSVKGHQLVANHFIENPNSLPLVNHIDSDRKNNYYWNLEWVSHAENTFHSQSQKGNNTIGITKRKDCKKYRARITNNGSRIDLGSYKNVEDAKAAINSFMKTNKIINKYANL